MASLQPDECTSGVTKDAGEEEEETRDWAGGLPLDALLAVLGRLDLGDVLLGAGRVCRPWRRAAREEPVLWRRIDIVRTSKLRLVCCFQSDVGHAVMRRARWCETICIDGNICADPTFIFVCFLPEAAPKLKRLYLTLCAYNTIPKQKQGLNEAINKLGMLEELELSLTIGPMDTDIVLSSCGSLAETCAVAAQACPLLKHLRLNKHRFHWRSVIGDDEAMEVAKMRGLRSLQLFANSLSNAGLAAILDGCVSLESLDIRHCFNVEMNDEMRAKCARLQTLRLPEDSMDDFELSFGCPEMEPPPRPWSPGDPDNIGSDWYFR